MLIRKLLPCTLALYPYTRSKPIDALKSSEAIQNTNEEGDFTNAARKTALHGIGGSL